MVATPPASPGLRFHPTSGLLSRSVAITSLACCESQEKPCPTYCISFWCGRCDNSRLAISLGSSRPNCRAPRVKATQECKSKPKPLPLRKEQPVRCDQRQASQQ